jgi:hypothetical protein
MSMSNATASPVPAALPVNDFGIYDGVAWFRTAVHDLSFDTYKALPKVVKYEGKMFVKMGWNTDNGTVSYKQSDAVAFG